MSESNLSTSENLSSLFDAQKIVGLVNTRSLAAFLGVVEKASRIPLTVQPDQGPRYDALFEHFLNAISQKAKDCGSFSEEWRMRYCLHPLLTYGDCVMEDTSEGAKDMSVGDWIETPFPFNKSSTSLKRKRDEAVEELTGPITNTNTNTFSLVHVTDFGEDLEADRMRAIAFKLKATHAKRPNYTIRLRCAGEEDMLKPATTVAPTISSSTAATASEEEEEKEEDKETEHAQTPVEYLKETRCRGKLPMERLLPYNIVSILEIKKMSESLVRHIKQVAYYNESYLRVTPGRRFIVSALTNLRAVVFVAAVAMEKAQGNVKYMCYHSDVIVPDENYDTFLAAQLAQLYAHTPEALGVTPNGFPFHVLKPTAVLGRGSTSCVFRCETERNTTEAADTTDTVNNATAQETTKRIVAAKVSHLPHAIAMEKWVLQRLASESMQGLPRVDFNFPMDAVQEPYRSCMLVLKRIYEPMTCEQWRTSHALFLDVWVVLEHAHSRGIVHRDVRPANCMWDRANGCVVMVDWSSASCFEAQPASSSLPLPELRVPGSIRSALDRVIEEYLRTNNALCEVFPLDEAQSMLYFACFALDETMEGFVPNKAEDDEFVWLRRTNMEQRFPHLPQRIERLRSLPNDSTSISIREEVHGALEVLCRSWTST